MTDERDLREEHLEVSAQKVHVSPRLLETARKVAQSGIDEQTSPQDLIDLTRASQNRRRIERLQKSLI